MPKPKMTQCEGHKWRRFNDIHSGLTADGYCLMAIRTSEDEGKLILEVGKQPHQKKNVDDDFLYSPNLAAEMSPDLQRLNLQDCNIFTTPYSKIYYYLLVDDVTLQNRDTILRDYFPCVVTETSFNKFQIILKVRKSECLGFGVGKFTDRLNEEYGNGKNTDGAMAEYGYPGMATETGNVMWEANRFSQTCVFTKTKFPSERRQRSGVKILFPSQTWSQP